MTDLSPAAKAVRSAFNKVSSWYHPIAVAAALRAAADEVVPKGLENLGIRYELLRIASELEGQ